MLSEVQVGKILQTTDCPYFPLHMVAHVLHRRLQQMAGAEDRPGNPSGAQMRVKAMLRCRQCGLILSGQANAANHVLTHKPSGPDRIPERVFRMQPEVGFQVPAGAASDAGTGSWADPWHSTLPAERMDEASVWPAGICRQYKVSHRRHGGNMAARRKCGQGDQEIHIYPSQGPKQSGTYRFQNPRMKI